jgi:putative hydrolase of the HAD superfamily
VDVCWRTACELHLRRLAPFTVNDVAAAIRQASKRFWSDPERHRAGRLELNAARREVVSLALREMNVTDAALAADIGDAYSHHRDVGMEPLPEAIETVRWLRDQGRRLALLTNGGGFASAPRSCASV